MPVYKCQKCGKNRLMFPRQRVCKFCQNEVRKATRRRRYLEAKQAGTKNITANVCLSKKGVSLYIDNGLWYWECTNGLKSVEGFRTMGLCRKDAVRMLGGVDEEI